MRMKMSVLYILALVFVSIETSAQEAEGLVFDTLTINLGDISEDDKPIKVSFRYVNMSESPIVITQVKVTCGCTTPRYSKQPIMSGEKGEITIMYNPKGQAGVLSRNTFVYTNISKSDHAKILKIVGVVEPTKDKFYSYTHRMGALRLKQKSVAFRDMRSGQVRVGRIEVGNSGKIPLTLSAQGLPSYLSFYTEPSTIQPDSVADIVFTLRTAELKSEEKVDVRAYIGGLGLVSPIDSEIKITGEFMR